MGLTIARMRVRSALHAASIPPTIPTNIIPPTLSGPIAVDGVVTFVAGTWIGPATTFTFQLYLDGIAVGGATGPTYTFLSGDAGKVPTLEEIPAIGVSAFSQAYPPVIVTPIVVNPPYFVGATAAGSGNGSSVANRAAFSNINAVVAAAAAVNATAIGVYAPTGIDLSTIVDITNGGSAAFPISIIGVDASSVATLTEIRGARPSPWTFGLSNGSDSLRLHAGADYLDFQFLDFKNTGTGIRVCSDITELSVRNCRGTNVRRWLDTLISGTGITSARITGLLVQDCIVNGYSKSCIRLDHGTTDFLIEDVELDSERQDLDNFAVGVDIQNANAGIIRRVIARNGQYTRTPQQYWNGDGFLAEVICDVLEFDSCEVYGFTDAGFDLKSDHTTLTDCRAGDNKWNFKMTGGRAPQVPIEMLRCIGLDPYLRGGTGRSNQVYTEFGRVVVTDCAFADSRSIAERDREEAIEPGHTTDVFRVEGVGTITIVNTSVQMGPGVTLAVEAVGGTITGEESVQSPPTNSVLPTVTGTLVVGQTLSGTNGTFTGSGLTYTYWWLRDGLYIDNANASTYVIVAADVDHTLSRRVFAKNSSGYVGAATSLETAIIGASVPVNTVAPSISGLTVTGATLTGDTGTWTNNPTFTLQWIRGASTVISGATSATYVSTVTDEGLTLKFRVTPSGGGSVATSAATAVITAAGVETYFYIAPTTQGTGDGSTAADALGSLDLSLLPAAIAAAPAARHIRILSNLVDGTPCEYVKTDSGFISIYSHGGATVGPPTIDDPEGDNSKIYIEGWDAENEVLAQSTISSNRTLWTLPVNPEQTTSVGSWTVGGNLFRIEDGVDNLVFRFLNTERFEHCYKFANGANSDGINFRNLNFYNVRRFIECGDGTGGGLTMEVTNVLISNVVGVGLSKQGIRTRGNSYDWTITDCDINSGRQDRDNFSVCYSLDDTAHDISYIRCIGRNCHDSLPGASGFWNADGFSSELGNYNITRIACESYGNTDAGYDDKATSLAMQDCIAEDNKENYKFWKTATYENCTGDVPWRRGGQGLAPGAGVNIQPTGNNGVLTAIGGSYTGGPYIKYDTGGTTTANSRASFSGTTFSGGSGFFSVDGSGITRGVSVYESDCVGLPDNHAAATTATYVSSASVGNNGSINLALPANEHGDVAVALIVGDTATAPTITDIEAGWTYFGAAVAVGAFGARLAWKRLAGQTFQNVVLAAGSGSHMRVAAIWAVAGCVATGDPFEGYASASGTGTTLTSPTTVVSGANRAVYRVFCKSSNIARSATPAGYTQRVSVHTAYGASGGIYVDSKESVGASTEAASESTIGASHPWISFGFALTPFNSQTAATIPVYSQDVAISGSTSPGATLTRVPGIVAGSPSPTVSWGWNKRQAGGSTGPFFTDGGTQPFDQSSTMPTAAYDSTTNKTWCVWEATIGTGATRYARVRVLDHDTGTWSSVYTVFTGDRPGDDHGRPAVVIDHQGYAHVFGGTHGDKMKHSRTTVAGDPSAWTAEPSLADFRPNGLTYPHPIRVGNDIYLFARLGGEGRNPPEMVMVVYKSTAVNNGVITWAAVKELFSFGNQTRCYLGNMALRGTKIYMGFRKSDLYNTQPSQRFGFLLYYETTDGSIHNLANTYSETSAQLPVRLSFADAETHFSVIPVPVTTTTHATFIVDASDVLHIFYFDGSGWFRKTLISGVYGTPEALSSDFRIPSLYLDGSDRIVAIWKGGGGIQMQVRAANGVWGATAQLHTWTHAYGEGDVASVYPSGSEARAVWCERQLPATNESGQLKGWLWGDSGVGSSSQWITVQANGATYSATVSGNEVQIVETATNTEGSDVSTSATKTVV